MTKRKDEIPESPPQMSGQDLLLFGRNVVRRRRGMGWNQRELALRVSIPSSRLSRLERGKVEPRLKEVVRLREVLGGTVDELISEPDPEPSASCLAQLLREMERSATEEQLELLCRMLRLLTRGIRSDPTD